MPYTSEELDAIERLEEYYNSNSYNVGTNPGGLAAGGHRINFIPALQDIALLAPAIAEEAVAAASSAGAAATSASDADTFASNAAVSETNAANAAAAAQAAAASSKWKGSVRAATTANITLSGEQTIDGVSVVAGDRVLVKNQSTASQNGVYIAAAGAWSRATDMDSWTELVSAMVMVEEGSLQAEYMFVCTVNAGGTLGSTSVTWSGLSLSALIGTLALSQLASQSNNTIVGNFSGSPGSPSAIALAASVATFLQAADADAALAAVGAGTGTGGGRSVVKAANATDILALLRHNFDANANIIFQSYSINNNAAVAIPVPSGARFLMAVMGSGSGTESGIFMGIAGSTGTVNTSLLGTNFEKLAAGGALTGTTGASGKVTVSSTSTNLYIENRRGSTLTYHAFIAYIT